MEQLETYFSEQFPVRDGLRTVKAETETALLGKADTNGYFKVEDGIYHLEAELNEKNVGRVADSVEKLCAEQFQNADCYVAVIPDKNYYLADKQYPTLDYERLDEMIQAEIPSAQKISLYGKLHLKDYYRTDLHWKQEKITGVVDTLVQSMGQQTNTISDGWQIATEDFVGAARFVCGLCKKVLIADSLAPLVSTLQNISETAAKAESAVTTGIRAEGAGIGTLGYWVLALAFMLQLYYDFSGYSDMAIGLGKILGFTFPENFRYPFISKSISEFWRRWHMTLGGWFRDYLYIPLGGNRVSVLRWCFNMFVVWLLSGLWHGAGWNFALWGLYFGAFLSAEKLIGRKWKERSFKIADISANNDSNGGNRENMFLTCVRNIIEHGYVLLVVLFSFVIFRVESVREIKEQLLGLAGSYGNAMTPMAAYEIKSCLILLLIACAGATPFPAMCVQRLKNTNMWKKSGWLLQSCYILTGLVLATAFLLGSSVHPFLYFRF